MCACVAARKALDCAFISSGYFGPIGGVESARGLGLAIAPVAAIKERCLFNCEALFGVGGACRLLYRSALPRWQLSYQIQQISALGIRRLFDQLLSGPTVLPKLQLELHWRSAEAAMAGLTCGSSR